MKHPAPTSGNLKPEASLFLTLHAAGKPGSLMASRRPCSVYSPLKQIDATNVGKLGLAWSAPSAKRAPKVFEFVLVILGRVWV